MSLNPPHAYRENGASMGRMWCGCAGELGACDVLGVQLVEVVVTPAKRLVAVKFIPGSAPASPMPAFTIELFWIT